MVQKQSEDSNPVAKDKDINSRSFLKKFNSVSMDTALLLCDRVKT